MHARRTLDSNTNICVALGLVPHLVNKHEHFTMDIRAVGCILNLVMVHLENIN